MPNAECLKLKAERIELTTVTYALSVKHYAFSVADCKSKEKGGRGREAGYRYSLRNSLSHVLRGEKTSEMQDGC